MRHASNEKRETTHDRTNGTNKSRKNKNAWIKGNVQILRHIGSRHHQRRGDKRKNLKSTSQEKEKATRIKLNRKNLKKGING